MVGREVARADSTSIPCPGYLLQMGYQDPQASFSLMPLSPAVCGTQQRLPGGSAAAGMRPGWWSEGSLKNSA